MTRVIQSRCIAVLLAMFAGAPTPAASPGIAGHQLPLQKIPVTERIQVPAGPGWLEVGYGSIWVSKSDTHEVLRIDPIAGRVVAKIPVGGDPELGIGVGLGFLWIPDPKNGTITQISPDTNRVVRVIKVPLAADPEGSIGVGAGSLWVLTNNGGTDSGTLTRLDARSGKVQANIPVQPQSHAALFAFDAVWVTSSVKNTVRRIDPGTNRVTDTIEVAAQPRFMASGDDAVWVFSQGDGSVSRIDSRKPRVAAHIALDVPGEGGDLAVGEGAVWVSAEGVPVSQVDPVRNELVSQFVGGKKDDTMRVGFGSIWVISELDGEIWRISADALKRMRTSP
jgi:virginiamycin B lyase